MKKFFNKIALLAVVLATLGGASTVHTTLYNTVTQDLGLSWSSVETRAELAAEYGVFQYTGTSEQNILLESRIRETHGFDLPADQLGFSVATGYKSTVRTSMSATQSTISVSSLTLRDGQTLDMSALGSVLFLSLESGKDKEEIAMCTGITTSTLTFTGCTRGLAFSGTDTSSVAANRQTHNAGSTVVLSNSHYVFDQLADLDTAQTISAPYTFTSSSPNIYYTFPVVSSTGYTGLPTNNGDLASKYYVDTVGAGGFTSLNVSTTKGLEVYGTSPETVGINASSTTGMGFDSSGALYQKTSSTLGLGSDSNGIYIKEGDFINFDSSGNITVDATSTPTASKIPIANASSTLDNDWIDGYFLGDGSDGALNVTSGTTTIDISSAKVIVKEYTSINISAGATLAFSNSASTGSGIIFKSQGACTVAGTVDGTSTGGANGTGETSGTGNGTDGANGISIMKTADGGNEGSHNATSVGAAGTFADIVSSISTVTTSFDLMRFPFAVIGAGGGGGSGAGTNAVGGAGGDGAGLIIMQCASLDFSGTINFSGQNGSDGSGSSGSSKSGGGGGGGAGTVIVLYDTLTANTGTVSVSGGTGGNTGPNGDGGTAYGAGGGGSWTSGIIGTTSTGTGAKTGGNGGDGLSYILQNDLYF